MGFNETWFNENAQAVIAELACSVADVDGLVVEIGSWEGRSTVALANAINPRMLHAVDTWQGSPSDVSAELAAQRDVFATWQLNVNVMTAGNVECHRMDWRAFVPSIVEPVAFAFIDAEHTYDEVADNLAALLPLLAAGGVLCGDDYTHPPVRAAVLDTLGAVTVNPSAPMVWIYRLEV